MAMLPPPHSVDGRAHASQSLSPRKERVPPLLASPGDLSMRGLQDCTWLAIVAVGPYIPAPTLLPATPPRPPGPSQCQLLPADSVFTPPSLGPSGHHRPLLCILRASGPAPPQLRHPGADRPHLLTLFLHPQCWPFLVPQQTPGMQRPHEAPSAQSVLSYGVSYLLPPWCWSPTWHCTPRTSASLGKRSGGLRPLGLPAQPSSWGRLSYSARH